jgi:hypothetical protein
MREVKEDGRVKLTPWGDAADAITKAIKNKIGTLAREHAEIVYDELLTATQDYLSDNTRFNLRSELDAARRQAEVSRQTASELAGALQEAVDVFAGMNDDEINVELLPRLRAALSASKVQR